MNIPPDLGPCLFCRRATKGAPGAPELITLFVAATADNRFANVPVHVSCWIEVVAGRVQEAVIEAIQEGRLTRGIDTAGSDLHSVVGSILGEVLNRYTRGG